MEPEDSTHEAFELSVSPSDGIEELESQPEQPKEASLLGLPAELREKIYKFAVVSRHPIQIGRRKRLPGLVRTNRQLYNESRSIFLRFNTFQVSVRDLKPFLPRNRRHWCADVPATQWAIGEFEWKMDNWAKLKAWMRNWHDPEGLIKFGPSAGTHLGHFHFSMPRQTVATWLEKLEWDLEDVKKIGETVDRMRELPWSQVEKVLEAYKAVMQAEGHQWV